MEDALALTQDHKNGRCFTTVSLFREVLLNNYFISVLPLIIDLQKFNFLSAQCLLKETVLFGCREQTVEVIIEFGVGHDDAFCTNASEGHTGDDKSLIMYTTRHQLCL